jgi:AmpD protein
MSKPDTPEPNGSVEPSASGESAEWGQGWWQGARHLVSPNFDERPPAAMVDMVVIHYISLPDGQFGTGYPLDLFCNRLDTAAHPDLAVLQGLKVSAHFFINRAGEVTQLVSIDHRAWHAGVSSWQGRVSCNDFSIGIELEGDGRQAFEDAQYASLQALCGSIATARAISHWVGHQDIAPERKSDPGPFFDWSRLLKKVAATDPRVQK